MTDKALTVQGCRLLNMPDVAEAIERQLAAADLSAQRILSELGAVATSTARDIAAAQRAALTGTLEDLPDHVAAAVARVDMRVTEYGTNVAVRLYDKVAALALLAKIRRMVSERREITGADGGPLETAVAFYLPKSPHVVAPDE